jgi:hypothetical protein
MAVACSPQRGLGVRDGVGHSGRERGIVEGSNLRPAAVLERGGSVSITFRLYHDKKGNEMIDHTIVALRYLVFIG